jgi:Uma2 family endonuclease
VKTLERPKIRRTAPFRNEKLWTAEECETLCEQGLIAEHYELIEGKIVEEMRTSAEHFTAIKRLQKALIPLFGFDYVRVEGTIRLSEGKGQKNLLVPDVTITRGNTDTYAKQNPLPADLLLVAEVAESSLQRDLSVKARLYAEVGIPEYWVLVLKKRRLLVHRDPTPKGYQSVTEWGEGESVSPLALPHAVIAIAGLLPEKK